MKPIQAKATLLGEIEERSEHKLNTISYISVMSDHLIASIISDKTNKSAQNSLFLINKRKEPLFWLELY